MELKLSFRDLAEQKLIAWGLWATGGIGIGYPSKSIMPETGGGIPIPPITDNEGLLIDAVILGIQDRDRDAFDLAILHYQEKIPIYKTRFGKDRGAALNAFVIETVQRALFPNSC